MTKVEYDRKRYLVLREQILVRRKEHRLRNRERLLAYSRAYYHAHRQKSAETSKEYRRTHKQEIKQASVRYYLLNREQILAAKKQYHKEHPECSIATRENRRARAEKASRLTLRVVQEAYERNIKKYGTLTCYLCGEAIRFGQDSLEHKIPLSRNGTHDIDNLDIAHCSCNASKHNKTEAEYREWQKCLG